MDLDNDGRKDWLLWLTDEAKNGNYRGYRALIVSNVSESEILQARVLP